MARGWGVALQKNYMSIYLSALKGEVLLLQFYSGQLGKVKASSNNFSFRTYEDLDVQLLTLLFAEAEQIFNSDLSSCAYVRAGAKALRANR